MQARAVVLLVLALGAAAGAATAQTTTQRREKFASPKAPDLAPWKSLRPDIDDSVAAQAATPFKIFDNVYYVGTRSYSSYVITTSAGLILIDTTWAHTAELVLNNIKSVGLDPTNIKYILITHGHGDHAAGTKTVRDAAGARVAMAAEDWTLYEKVPSMPGRQYETVPRDLVIKDGDTLTLGDATFRFYLTPGHTPGCMSMVYTVYDRGKPYTALTLGGLGLTFGPEWTQTFIAGLERMRALAKVEVLLPEHPYMGDMWAKSQTLSGRGPTDPNPFHIGRAGVLAWFDTLLKAAREKQRIEQSSH
jgi:metallo-beta-lactamase class B